MSTPDRLTDEEPRDLAELVAKMLAGPTGAAHHATVPPADGVPVTIVPTADLVALRDGLAARLAAPLAEHPDTVRLREVTSRLGFGDGVTEPQADNDTIVGWVEERDRVAAEWDEHERWRIDCHLAGHPDDEDCYEHDPHLAAQPPATDRDAEDEEATRDAIYSALHEVLACDPMWIGDDGEPLDYLPEREVLIGDAVERQTDAVLSVLAARPAPDTLADHVRALHRPIEVHAYDEVNGVWQTGEDGEKVLLATFCRECSSDDVVSAIEDVEWHEDWFGYGEVAHPCATVALLAGRSEPTLADRVQALADEWDALPPTNFDFINRDRRRISADLRALVAGRSDASPEGGEQRG